MQLHGIVQIYIYHILYDFGVVISNNNCFITVVLNPMWNNLKPTHSRRHLPLLTAYNNKTPTPLSSINIGCSVYPHTVRDRYTRNGRGSGKQTRTAFKKRQSCKRKDSNMCKCRTQWWRRHQPIMAPCNRAFPPLYSVCSCVISWKFG